MKKTITRLLLLGLVVISMTACKSENINLNHDMSGDVEVFSNLLTNWSEYELAKKEAELEESETLEEEYKETVDRTAYMVSYQEYLKYKNGEMSYQELCEIAEVTEQKIVYTADGCTVTESITNQELNRVENVVSTYDSRGEIVKKTITGYYMDFPDEVIEEEKEYLWGGEFYYNESWGNYCWCTDAGDGIEYDEANPPHEVKEEENRTILYSNSKCYIEDPDSGENIEVIKNLDYKVYEYNAEGKIESIYVGGNRWRNGMNENGDYYTTVDELVDYMYENINKIQYENDTEEVCVYWTKMEYDGQGRLVEQSFKKRDGGEKYVIFYKYK